MKLQISKRMLVQYILIYLLLICHDAGIYRNNAFIIRNLIIFGSVAVIFLFHIKVPQRVWLYGAMVVLIMQMLKIWHSDVYFDYEMKVVLEHLIIAYTAFAVDKELFTTRFIKTIVFFASTSLVFYILANTMPSVVETVLTSEYELAWAGSFTVQVQGWLLYAYRAFEPNRNSGIFTEPGVYQILLSAGIYLLLFCSRGISFSKRKQMVALVILTVTMLTTTSTTAYISLAVLLLFGALQNKKLFPNHKALRWVFVIGAIALTADISVNGESSLIWSNVIEKLSSMNKISDSTLTANSMWNSSGNARLAILIETLPLLFTKPFGVGFTYFYGLLKTLYAGNAAGARLLIYIASMGLISTCAMLYPLFRRAFKYRRTWFAFVAYVFIFLNTGFAQSKAIYASFAVIPFLLEYLGGGSNSSTTDAISQSMYD